MIVRNEAPILKRCLDAVSPWIDRYVVCDTGSTDETPEIVRSYFEEKGIPGTIPTFPFVDFSQARNAALEHARIDSSEDEYVLLVDADMELVVGDVDFKRKLFAPNYMVRQHGGYRYENVRLLRTDVPARYVLETHEYLDIAEGPTLDGVSFLDHGDGSSHAEKSERDVRLLLDALERRPNDARAMFYLAQTYLDLGRHHDAIFWYRRRIALGGNDQEEWFSEYKIALSYLAAKDEDAFVRTAFAAFERRPSRIEPLYALASYYREKGRNSLANMVIRTALTIPRSSDRLFVDDGAWTHGIPQEASICGFYALDPETRQNGYRSCMRLVVDGTAPREMRELALSNAVYYAPLAKERMPSFSFRRIGEEIGDGTYVATNPSVAYECSTPSFLSPSGSRILVNVRLVNYAVPIYGQGSYSVRSEDGRVRTRNAIVEVDANGAPTGGPKPLVDLVPAPFGEGWVLGFEDLRIFRWNGKLWATATALDHNPEGRPEIVLLEFEERLAEFAIVAAHVQRSYVPERCQKNWLPFVREGELLLLYGTDPTVVLRVDPITMQATEHRRSDPDASLETFRGSSPLVPFRGGWLYVVHEASDVPNETRRYLHRLVELDGELRVRRFSDPFRFLHTGIEFCAGATWIPDGRLMLTFGFEDREAYVATVTEADVEAFLEQGVVKVER